MKDIAQKRFEKWAQPHLLRIQEILLLEHFAPLKIEYSDKMPKDVAAEFQFSHPYQSIMIRYNHHVLDDFKKGDRESCLNILAHEMAHALTDPLFDLAHRRYVSQESLKDEREKLTDHIANIVIKNFPFKVV